MKILFIEPTFDDVRSDDVIFPFGYAALGGVLKRNGHKVEYLLPSAYGLKISDVLDRVGQTDAAIIGIGGLIPYLQTITSLVAQIKRIRPDIIVVLGGPMVTYSPELVIETTIADFCIAGEGEVALLKLVDCLEDRGDYSHIPGLIFRSGTDIINNGIGEILPFDQIPMPTWDDFPMEYYMSSSWYLPSWSRTKKERVFAWMLSRGCPAKCNFCASGCHPRYKNIEEGIKELREIVDRFNPDYIMFVDNFLMRNEKFIIDFCESIKRNGFKFKFSTTCKVNIVNENLLRHMKEAGCEIIFYGLECANDNILKFMKKGITVKDAERAIELTKKAGIYPMVSIMFGQPEETTDDFFNSIKIALSTSIKSDPMPNVASVMQLLTFPGTGIYQFAIEKGYFKDQFDYWNKYGKEFKIVFSELDQALIQKLIDKANLLYRWKYHKLMADHCLEKLREGVNISDRIKRRVKLLLRNNPRLLKLVGPVLGEQRINMIEQETSQEQILSEFVQRCMDEIVE